MRDRIHRKTEVKRIPQGVNLPLFKAKQRGICPWCHTYITVGSLIVKLTEPEPPDTSNGYRCDRTGGLYNSDGSLISLHPRTYAHYSCYKSNLIFESDGCHYCGGDNDLTIDHIVATATGGLDMPYNLTVACRSCNSRKGKQLVSVYVDKLNS